MWLQDVALILYAYSAQAIGTGNLTGSVTKTCADVLHSYMYMHFFLISCERSASFSRLSCLASFVITLQLYSCVCMLCFLFLSSLLPSKSNPGGEKSISVML